MLKEKVVGRVFGKLVVWEGDTTSPYHPLDTYSASFSAPHLELGAIAVLVLGRGVGNGSLQFCGQWPPMNFATTAHISDFVSKFLEK